MPNINHKHSFCYPTIEDGKLCSKNIVLNTKSDVQHTCACALKELCGALTGMLASNSSDSEVIIDVIHKITGEQDV